MNATTYNIEFQVVVADLPKVHLGQPFTLTIDSDSRQWTGTINYIDPTVDGNQCTIRGVLTDNLASLKPGMSATIAIKSDTSTGAREAPPETQPTPPTIGN